MVIDEPITYFVAKADSESSSIVSKNGVKKESLPSFDGDLKVHLFPMDKYEILIRIENLSDLFDGAPKETPMFDL